MSNSHSLSAQDKLITTNNKPRNIVLFSSVETQISQIILKVPCAKVIWGGDFNTVMDNSIDSWPPIKIKKHVN